MIIYAVFDTFYDISYMYVVYVVTDLSVCDRRVRVFARGGRQRVAGGRDPRLRHAAAAAAAPLSGRAAPLAAALRLLGRAPLGSHLQTLHTYTLKRYHCCCFT